jgi:hypothetical protein
MQRSNDTADEARATAKESTAAVGKATLELVMEIMNKAQQQQLQLYRPVSYAAAAARGFSLAGTYNIQSCRTPIVQTQREVVVKIKD